MPTGKDQVIAAGRPKELGPVGVDVDVGVSGCRPYQFGSRVKDFAAIFSVVVQLEHDS